MNPVLAAIESRRSVRSYESKAVPKDVLITLIEAANQAPSGLNSQPWRFVVVEDETFKKKLLETAIPNCLKYLEDYVKPANPQRYELILRRYAELPDPVYYSAPAMIFVIGTGAHAADSCPMACQNIMLAAESLGLGTCWVKFGSLVTTNADIVDQLELKAEEAIFGPILVGYPKEIPRTPAKKPPLTKWI
jgi:nitroreductase